MITVTSESLPAQAEHDLREWLRRPAMDTLKRVVSSKLKDLECKALRDAVSATKSDSLLDRANIHLQQAQRYNNFLEVLTEIEGQTSPFTLVKLS